jgi:hypothetical protein
VSSIKKANINKILIFLDKVLFQCFSRKSRFFGQKGTGNNKLELSRVEDDDLVRVQPGELQKLLVQQKKELRMKPLTEKEEAYLSNLERIIHKRIWIPILTIFILCLGLSLWTVFFYKGPNPNFARDHIGISVALFLLIGNFISNLILINKLFKIIKKLKDS